ncbi:CRAL TRIO domain containing protein [Musa troglodytarum]|uniref:CRAL TRIO domain containing protein n=1 Tax=Musa troglodytarum TaxID=320322 RepID=A0A9E7GVX8_9LILI|nr:CRAL TRIO domain containing protein [Musa troglodytarum]
MNHVSGTVHVNHQGSSWSLCLLRLVNCVRMNIVKSKGNGVEKSLSFEEQKAKINEVREILGPMVNMLPNLCSDASVSRYLRARNWNVEKASKMLKESLKWRLEYKPETIRWDDVAHEAETGKIYRADYLDKNGRAVLVMRPGFQQNTSSSKGQIRYLVYCMENAIFNLAANQEQMVWLIDFQGWTMGSVSIKVTRETAHILQDYYPERLALGILYNPPRIFESFWKVVRPFLEHKTYKKVKFVYSDNTESQKIMTDLFEMDKLESAFGGHNPAGFDLNKYAEKMKEDDQKMSAFVESASSVFFQEQSHVSVLQPEFSVTEHQLESSSDSSPSSDAESPRRVDTKILSANEMKEQPNCKNTIAESGVSRPLIHMNDFA